MQFRSRSIRLSSAAAREDMATPKNLRWFPAPAEINGRNPSPVERFGPSNAFPFQMHPGRPVSSLRQERMLAAPPHLNPTEAIIVDDRTPPISAEVNNPYGHHRAATAFPATMQNTGAGGTAQPCYTAIPRTPLISTLWLPKEIHQQF